MKQLLRNLLITFSFGNQSGYRQFLWRQNLSEVFLYFRIQSCFPAQPFSGFDPSLQPGQKIFLFKRFPDIICCPQTDPSDLMIRIS